MSPETQPVLDGLAAAAQALEQNHLEEAADLLGNLTQLCVSSSARPVRLDGQDLKLAQELFARCQQAAVQRQAELAASLSQSVALRKASHAYQSSK